MQSNFDEMNSDEAIKFDSKNNPVFSDINEAIRKHIEKTFDDKEFIRWMSESFLKEGYIKVSNIVPNSVKKIFNEEVMALLSQHAKRRDIHIEVTDNSPRFMSNVRQQDIAKYGQVIPAVYHSPALLDFISTFSRENIIPNPWEYEKFIINRQERVGDTHGWHWGDYPYSMIWIIQVPDISYGGLLECVPHTYWDKKNPKIQEHLLRNNITTKAHISGDIYMLKSDTTLHRVTPLIKDATRIIVNMAWEREIDRDREVTHETFAFRD